MTTDRPGFEQDIRPIFARYVACMKNVVLTDEDGAAEMDLSSYDCVVRFHQPIAVAITGYRPGSTAPHPMPPGGTPLPDAQIDLYLKWVETGMAR
ncbi:hypothetical protein [Novispirillum itersonii]|uniref:hypothetical protein n=1 Tax=Novispirillum itersonii TaxID=189 RepID=UPI000378C1F6|nr:hypothetical protein [Novispirillum itersonii]